MGDAVKAGGRPSGTVTFLFTDIEGSTGLWERHPDAMRMALARHDELLAAAVAAFGGVVFATGGDGVAAVFGRAAEAVGAAISGQREMRCEPWPEGVELRVRMGLHTGEAEERGGDFFGPAVNRAARVMGSANGGQTVLSAATAGVLENRDSVRLIDLGLHRLKGVSDEMRLLGVDTDDAPWVNRPLSTEQVVPGNLPRLVTEFVGRVDVLQRRATDLADRRLVTLTGTGGVGKTRTAIEVGWLVLDQFPGGVWLLELAPIADAEVVIAAVASSLGVAPQPGMTTLESTVEWLAGRRALLILDNCEHVLGPVAELVSAIMAKCPTVTVLATSREPLGVHGERVVPVASLAAADAIELFCERAVAADATLEFSTDEVAIIGRICDRLDGIPLAIELAAARARSLSVDDLAARLDDRFRLLRGSGRGGLERHQTLRAAVAWSYQLLGASEQLLFDRVSVFAGGFDLGAAEAVCADDDGVGVDDVVDLLGSLVDKSMVNADRTERQVRYQVLETLRQYGEERLADRAETATLRDRHGDHYLSVTKTAWALQMGRRQLDGDATMEREWDNIRAAVGWASETGRRSLSSDFLWHILAFAMSGMRYEVGDWAEQLLVDDSPDDPQPSRHFLTAATFAMLASDWQRSVRLARIAIERSPDPDVIATGWFVVVIALGVLGNHDEAIAALEHARVAAAVIDDPYVHFWVLFGACNRDLYADPERRPDSLGALDAHAKRCGAPWMLAHVENFQGVFALDRDDHDGALESFRSGLAVATSIRSLMIAGQCAAGIVTALLEDADSEPTAEVFDMLALIRDTRNWSQLGYACEPVANYLARRDELGTASVVAGVLQRQAPFGSFGARMRTETLELIATLPNVEALLAQGATLSAAEAMDLALEHVDTFRYTQS